jgi:motility quorum-sensing regulator/GCU-specific mRNA interferase toxin
MQKRTPHCKLSVVKSLLEEGRVRSTQSARQGAAVLGIDFAGMCEIVKLLTSSDFHKSMTTYADHKAWQDVYHPSTEAGDVYLKLSVINALVIISFKEL